MNSILIKKPEFIFLLFSLIFGLFLIFFTPPLMSADEPAHFSRIYSLSEGNIASAVVENKAGNFVPYALKEFENKWSPMFYDTSVKTDYSQINNSKNIKIDNNKLYFSNQCYQTLYSPLAYLPQTAGVFIAKLFTQSVYWILITAKIFLLIFYILSGYFAVKSTPVYKWLFVLVLLCPTSLSLGCSVSADGVVIPLSIFYLAKIFEYTFREKDLIENNEIMYLCILAVFLSLVKQSFLVTLLIFFIPKSRFGSKYWGKILLILLPAFISTAAWTLFSSKWFVPLNNSNPFLQTKFIISHPFVYLVTLFKTIKMCMVMWIYSTIGVLGWNNLFLFPIVYILYFIAVCLNAIYKELSPSVTLKQNLILAGVFLLNFVFICTELYVSWTPPYFTEFISIVQGRYLIPVVLPLLCFLGFLCISKRSITSGLAKFNCTLLFIAYLNLFFSMYIVYYF